MAINLTTLKYVVALDIHRNFVKAAESCSVSQPSLSMAIRNLESDLDIQIFDRGRQPIVPTLIGEQIIAMARKTIGSAQQIEEFVAGVRGEEIGDFSLCVHPTVAPYILADFFKSIRDNHPGIHLRVEELRIEPAVRKLQSAEFDALIMPTPLGNAKLLEVPLYRERYLAYVSPDDPLSSQPEIRVEQLATDRLWMMEEGYCLQSKVLSLCAARNDASVGYHAGSVATLVDIVDKNGGYTIIPQLHADLLCEKRKKNLRAIVSLQENCPKCVPSREISLVIREDYVRERLLNIVADTIKTIIPKDMIDGRLKKFSIVIR